MVLYSAAVRLLVPSLFTPMAGQFTIRSENSSIMEFLFLTTETLLYGAFFSWNFCSAPYDPFQKVISTEQQTSSLKFVFFL